MHRVDLHLLQDHRTVGRTIQLKFAEQPAVGDHIHVDGFYWKVIRAEHTPREIRTPSLETWWMRSVYAIRESE